MRATSPLTAARGSQESASVRLPGASETAVPPLSKSLLSRSELTRTSSGRRWCRSVPGPAPVPKSPCDLAQTCSRFQSLAPPPFVVLLCERPEYRRMTLLLLFGRRVAEHRRRARVLSQIPGGVLWASSAAYLLLNRRHDILLDSP